MRNKTKTAILGVLLMMSMTNSAFAEIAEPTKRGLSEQDKKLPQNIQQQIMSLKLQYEEAEKTLNIKEMTKAHDEAEKIRDTYSPERINEQTVSMIAVIHQSPKVTEMAQSTETEDSQPTTPVAGSMNPDGTYNAVDGSTFTYADVVRVAALINHEAAPYIIDKFMVAATFVDRLHAGLRGDSVARSWGNTSYSVLNASGQYYKENSDSKHLQFVRDAYAYGYTKENNLSMYIAFQCLTGNFSIPSNVYGQAAGKQGGLYMYVNNKQGAKNNGYYNHQYCAMPAGSAIAKTDWAGRPAMGSNDAINLIYQLASQFTN